MASAEEKLESSKDRLRKAFAKLEDAVDRKVRVTESKAQKKVADAQKDADVSVFRQEVDKLNKQLGHLREEKSELQDALGKEKEATRQVRMVNQEASKRVDALIKEFKDMIKNN